MVEVAASSIARRVGDAVQWPRESNRGGVIQETCERELAAILSADVAG